MARRWSKKEIEFLQDHFEQMPTKQLTKKLNNKFGCERTEDAVRRKIRGFEQEESPWQKFEQKIIAKHQNYPIRLLKTLLPNKTQQQIQVKLRQIGAKND